MNKPKNLAAAVKRHAKECKKHKPVNRTLDDTLTDVRDFNEKNGTNLTYGQYTGLRDFGGY